MENRLKSQAAASQNCEDEADPLEQLLNRTYQPIVRTLAFNLRRLSRKNYDTERSTMGLVYRSFSSELDLTSRDMVLDAVAESVASSNLPAECLLSFVENDSSPMIVTKAVRHYLELGECSLTQPLSAVQDILDLLDNRQVTNAGIILAGLIAFGDRRVCAALRPYQNNLSLDAMRQFAISVKDDHLHKSSIYHCLNWLIDLLSQSPEKSEQATLVASATTRMILHAGSNVEDREFHFGVYAFKSYTSTLTSSYGSLLEELEPLLKILEQYNNAAVEKMIHLFRNPTVIPSGSDRRHDNTRRKSSERRGSDRRVISIAPEIERRRETRRNLQRRQAVRR